MFPMKKKMPQKLGGSPLGKKPDDLESPDPVEGKPVDDTAEEGAETPDTEAGEQGSIGEKLTSDIDAVFEAQGIDAAQGRTIAADLFRAVADCLGGGDDVAEKPPEPAGPQRYGR